MESGGAGTLSLRQAGNCTLKNRKFKGNKVFNFDAHIESLNLFSVQ